MTGRIFSQTPTRGSRRFLSDTRGAAAAIFAVSLVGLIGFGALGIETGLWFTQKRHLQTQADAAAISGAFQLAASQPLATIQAAGTAMAVNNGYVNAAPNVITIDEGYWDGTSFTNGGTPLNAVRATLATPKATLFAAIALPTVTIGAQAVAIYNTSFGSPCAEATDPNGSSTDIGIDFTGTATVNMPGCTMTSDSTNPTKSINLSGNPNVTVQNLYSAGGYNVGGNTKLDTGGQIPVAGAAPTPDPWASTTYTMPTSACLSVTGTTLTPGRYGDISLSGGQSYTLGSGTYYVDGNCPGAHGNFSIQAGATVNSAPGGVTVILGTSNTTSTAAQTIGSFNIATSTGVLDASSSGQYQGLLFYQDPRATSPSQADTISGGSNLILQGDIYIPGNTLTFNGTSSTDGSTACLQIVAYQIIFSGTSSLADSGCQNDGISVPGNTNVVLAQ